jgi:MFS family permease
MYFIGIGFSHVGTWMQVVALGWLVLELTGSGTALGTVLSLRFAPLLFGGLFAGTIVDSFDKRTLLYVTQSVSASVSLVLSSLIFFGVIQLWVLYIAGVLLGLADALDRPARQTYVHEMVGPKHLRNAVSLNSMEANLARTVGPLFAGILIAGIGIATCYFLNAVSYVVFIYFLTRIRSSELHREERKREVGGALDGFRYVASVPFISTVLVAMALIGTLTYEFQTSLPLLAHTTFGGNAADYAALLSAMGIGSVVGGLYSAGKKSITARELIIWAALFGFSTCVTALMPTLSLATLGMVFVGFFSVAMSSTGNTLVQLESAAHMRGRVLSLWTTALFGSTVIGAPLIGFIGEYASPRWALGLGGVAALVAATFMARRLLQLKVRSVIPAFISLRREEADTFAQK